MPVKFTADGVLLKVQAQFILRLLPKPSLVIELDDLPADTKIDFENPFFVTLENGNEIEVSCISWNTQTSDSGAVDKCVLVPTGGICTLLRTDEQLQSVAFNILNFPMFFKGQDKVFEAIDDKGKRLRLLGAVKLETHPWLIEICAVPELEETKKRLQSEGGYAVTHIGIVVRSDGKTFSVEEVKELITHTLRLFLSFASGSFCGVVDLKGRDHTGGIIWRLLGSPIVDPWSTGRQSWFDTMHGHVLSEVFEGFHARLNDTNMGVKTERGLYWYLLGNRGTGFSDADTVLVQAALEYLAYVQLKDDKRGQKASDIIKNALVNIGICVDIPNSCQKLYNFAEEHDWKHGPHALTELRNDMIHAKQRYETVPSGVHYEAKNLGLWYVEMVLLRFFKYCGVYSNRLVERWVGEVEPVPWAQESE